MFDEYNIKSVYRHEGKSVQKYNVIHETENSYILVPDGVEIMVEKKTTFSDIMEARYSLIVKRIQNNETRIQNFKHSKYWDYYIKRAIKENPELLI